MSVSIYGYIEALKQCSLDELRKIFSSEYLVGVNEENLDNLLNWPTSYLPTQTNVIAFSVHDKPGIFGCEILLDYIDYSPDADIDLPFDKNARLEIFTSLIFKLIHSSGISRVLIAITDSCQISSVKHVDIYSFPGILASDLSFYSPPDIMYVITKTTADLITIKTGAQTYT
jgi:hypothetical protein